MDRSAGSTGAHDPASIGRVTDLETTRPIFGSSGLA